MYLHSWIGGIVVFVQRRFGVQNGWEVKVSDTTEHIKSEICDKEGISPDQYQLIYAGQLLKDEWLLSDYTTRNQSILHLVLKVRG